jgi:hypothetical protein
MNSTQAGDMSTAVGVSHKAGDRLGHADERVVRPVRLAPVTGRSRASEATATPAPSRRQ